jgi:hypothetical protein
MDPGFSNSHESMLSWALKIIAAAPELSDDDCATLQAKIESVISTRQTMGELERIKTAHAANFQLGSMKPFSVWQPVRKNLTLWQNAFRFRHGIPREQLSQQQRESLTLPMDFDMSKLTSKELDVLFLLAYIGVDSLSSTKFNNLYKECIEYSSTGAQIRSIVERYLLSHDNLGHLSQGLSKKSTKKCKSKKRSLDNENPGKHESLFYALRSLP